MALLFPTRNILNKSTFDAVEAVRDLLRDEGVHDYDRQGLGRAQHGVNVPARIGTRNHPSQASLYRPGTKDGAFRRIWFTGLAVHASPGDVLAILVDRVDDRPVLHLYNLTRDGGLDAPDTNDIFVDPPAGRPFRPRRRGRGAAKRRSEADAALGRAGEEWVCELERRRLSELGRPDLASRVEHVSVTRGDGLGYDVESVEVDGAPRHIEVKTTRGPADTPYIITSNEVRASEELRASFWLYRVFDFDGQRRAWTAPGPVTHHAQLDPTEYRAHPGRPDMEDHG